MEYLNDHDTSTKKSDEHIMAPFLVAAANGQWNVLKKMIEFLDKNYAYDNNGTLQKPFRNTHP